MDNIHVEGEELLKRRVSADLSTIRVRWREVLRSLDELGLVEARSALDAAGADGGTASLAVLDRVKADLHRLRDKANEEGKSPAPIRSALDRVGALWAVLIP